MPGCMRPGSLSGWLTLRCSCHSHTVGYGLQPHAEDNPGEQGSALVVIAGTGQQASGDNRVRELRGEYTQRLVISWAFVAFEAKHHLGQQTGELVQRPRVRHWAQQLAADLD